MTSISLGQAARPSRLGMRAITAAIKVGRLSPCARPERFLDALADLHEVLGVLFGNEHCFDAPTQGREQLLLETGDRPHAAAQRDLAGHGGAPECRSSARRSRWPWRHHLGRHPLVEFHVALELVWSLSSTLPYRYFGTLRQIPGKRLWGAGSIAGWMRGACPQIVFELPIPAAPGQPQCIARPILRVPVRVEG
jgi:hypothetical protein